jgi:hypothetical protein
LAFPVFLFVAQPIEFFLDGLKKLEQRSHKCVELRGETCGVNKYFSSIPYIIIFFLKLETYQPPLVNKQTELNAQILTLPIRLLSFNLSAQEAIRFRKFSSFLGAQAQSMLKWDSVGAQ